MLAEVRRRAAERLAVSRQRRRSEREAEVPVVPPAAEPAGASAAAAADHRPSEQVSWGMRVAAAWGGRMLVVAAAVYVLFLILDRVRLVAFAFVVALFITALLSPLVGILRRQGVPRSLAALLVLLFGLVMLGLAGWFVTEQVQSNVATLSNQVVDAGDKIRSYLVNGPLHLDSKQLSDLGARLRELITKNEGTLASGAFATASTALEAVSGALLVLFSTYFLLRDGDVVWAWAVRLFPAPARMHVSVAGGLGWTTLSGYVRGIVIVALADAVSVTVVLLIVGVPLAVPLGVLVFLGAFVPLVGLTLAGTISTLVALISKGPTAALIVLIAIILLVQAEGHILHPLVMSRAVRIHPLAVVLAVAAGTLVAGVEGAIVAVPLAAVCSSIGGYLRAVPPVARPAEPPKPAAPSKPAEPAEAAPAEESSAPVEEAQPTA